MGRAAGLFVAIGLLGGIAGVAKADGTIILNSAIDFQAAIDSGFLTGISVNQSNTPQQNASNSALTAAFPGQAQASSITTANSTIGGLLSSAAPPGNTKQYVSSWTYGYHIDPDLSNYTIKLGLYLPQVASSMTDSGINMVAVALTSMTLNSSNQPVYSSEVWGFNNVLTPGILSPDPSTHLENFSFPAAGGAGAGGSNYFNEDPGFSLQNVLYVSIGYDGDLGSSFPPTPTGGSALWTGTDSLNVLAIQATPEPGSVALLACGLLGAGALRSAQLARSRRRNRGGSGR